MNYLLECVHWLFEGVRWALPIALPWMILTIFFLLVLHFRRRRKP